MDVDVVVVGAGPTGLALAGELALAGVRALVLERRPGPSPEPRANGLGGQVLELLRCRGLLARVEAASGAEHPAPRYPFATLHLDFTGLADPPLRGVALPQAGVERVLAEWAVELGAEVRRGCEVVGLAQDEGAVTARLRGGGEVTGRYLVGCDGGRSRVRELLGVGFPGQTYPEVHRLGQVRVPASVTRRDGGHLELPGVGRVGAGEFTRTERGAFGMGWLDPDVLMVSTTEEAGEVDEGAPLTLAELAGSVERVLGAPLPMEGATRLSRYRHHARAAERHRVDRVFLAGEAAHRFPATGVGIGAGMLDSVNLAWKLAATLRGWAPPGLLDTYQSERRHATARTMLHTQAQVALRRGEDPAALALRELVGELLVDEQPLRRLGALVAGAELRYPFPGAHPLTGRFTPNPALRTASGATDVAGLLHAARPVLLALADRPDLLAAAEPWRDRVDRHTATAPDPVAADALLIRPDAHVAWAAAPGEPATTAVPALREALTTWFGEATRTAAPGHGQRR
ncbi:FAD-dependent monooxygenase [Actinosynnema mirum]|uniref:Monooxygenase FAD-binding n=1 Tax=Actinosynnema mirum (strain ATCC 29888 / DSM 43827 / JCM 3225 / NBRC 14064 / NCIMB 13271 / NRRL B-12336 / IMRU 3971 / 101) TaxID=446462 RepID=C6WAS9_ACTMD|nr:FAD-dependent monooxygenase [Actinosynnema mirum]ACU37398.1 monooxygenase FAD-binding [Actinosynnema mirum DSM 43827]